MSATKILPSVQELFIEALSLPSRSRAELAGKLISSLEQDSATFETEQKWGKEAASRYEAFRAGKLEARKAEDLRRAAYKKIQAHASREPEYWQGRLGGEE